MVALWSQEVSHSVYQVYPDATVAQTKAPAGYKPFYISHFGRHGSRYLSHENNVRPALDGLRAAQAEGILTRAKGTEDGRQMIVKITDKGRGMKKKLMCVPEAIGSSVLCETVTPETVPGLYCMLDGIIRQLNEKQTNK